MDQKNPSSKRAFVQRAWDMDVFLVTDAADLQETAARVYREWLDGDREDICRCRGVPAPAHTHRRRGLALPATALAAAGGSSPFTSASSFSSPAAAAQPGLRSPSASGARAPGRRGRCTRPRGGVTGCGCRRCPHSAPGSRDGSRRGPKDQKSRLGRAQTRRGHVPPGPPLPER